MTEKNCDNCNHSAVCRLLDGERSLRFLGTPANDPFEAVQKMKQELADRCSFFSGG